jgi:RHS repeat-associated protein
MGAMRITGASGSRAVVVCFLAGLSATAAVAAPTIQITSPLDQSPVNPTGGPPDVVEITYQVTGNTCTGFRSSYGIVPHVNGAAVACAGSGCSCDGTSESCNNVTKTITIDGNDFAGCLNTIRLEMSPRPFCSPTCISPCSAAILSATVKVWQSAYKDCTGPEDCNKSTVGRPIDVATGKMYHEMTDLIIRGPLSIELTRRYDSQSTDNGPVGFGWHHSYLMRLEDPGNNQRVFVDGQGRRVHFARNTQGGWEENRIDHLLLTQPGTPAFRVTDKHQTKYEFDTNGVLTRIADRNNNQLTFGYTSGDLTSITDTFGRTVTLNYAGGKLDTISAGSRTVSYTYTGDNLTRVDLPDGSFFDYAYNDPGDIHNLSTVTDALDHIVENHEYDGSDRVMHFESEGGVEELTISYDSATQTTVTNSRGIPTVYAHDPFSGLVTSSAGPGCASCGTGGASTMLTYDRFLNLTERIDGRGIHTQMPSHDGKGNVLTRIEAVGTPRQRTTTYTYHPTFNFVATERVPTVGTCTNPERVVTNTYNSSNGNLTQRQVTGCNGPDPFTYTTVFTYDGHGQVDTVDGPRTDVTDLTDNDYYPDADVDLSRRGRLMSVTNALGHQVVYNGYDLFGNAGSVTDENSVETLFLYDERDRLLERRILGATAADDIVTINVYDDAGNLDLVRLPNCVETGPTCTFSLDYGYDGANRLTEVRDPFGNRIVYGYDTESNRTREEFLDPLSAIQRFANFAYDSLNHLEYIYFNDLPLPPDPSAIFWKFSYDGNGNRTSERDPEGHVTIYVPDELNRLESVTRTVGVTPETTMYGYDVQDNLASVTDPAGLVTSYVRSDMSWQLEVVSPATGTTTYTYDPAGNQLTSLNNLDILVSRTYDALDRPLTVTYPDSSLDATQSYDSALVSFGIGRRTGMTDPSGSTVYHYDRRGLRTMEEKTIQSVTFTTQYFHDKTGNEWQVLYPTSDPNQRQGAAVFTFDPADQITAVTTSVDGVMTSVASGIAYKPFGPPTNVTFSNGRTDSLTYDSRYRLGSWTLSGLLDYTHGYNDDDNLTARLDNLDSANDRSFGYDEAHRLTDASGPWGAGTSCVATSSTYEYDLNGNRTCKGEGASSTTYTYAAGSNQISTAMGAESATYSHDTAGNVTGDGTHTFGFDDAGRLAAVDGGATATYTYDGEGRRVIKTAGGEITYFFYHPDGKLLTEMVPADEAGKDYIYLGDTPLARMDWAAQEVPLGEIEVLAATASAPNVHLDWSAFPAGSNRYVVRRKQIVDFSDKSFDGNVVIATPQDPVQTFDDPVLGDANDYFYRVFRRVLSDALYLYHADHLGTPIAMTDGAGALVWRAEHLPFGGIHTLPVSSVENNLRFSGQYLDGETGLHQNWFRDYDRAIGRYREPDPIGLSLSTPTNLYAYVDSLPTTFVDLLGLVRTAADCSVCCTAEEAQRELDQSWQWTQTQSSKYRWGPIRTCRGYSCGRSADELRWDLEANVKPMCWITSTQLTPGFAGKAFHKLIGRPLGLQGPTAYFSVHFVVKYQPCEGPAPNYFFDAYIGAKHGILDPSEEIQ